MVKIRLSRKAGLPIRVKKVLDNGQTQIYGMYHKHTHIGEATLKRFEHVPPNKRGYLQFIEAFPISRSTRKPAFPNGKKDVQSFLSEVKRENPDLPSLWGYRSSGGRVQRSAIGPKGGNTKQTLSLPDSVKPRRTVRVKKK